MKYLKKKGLDVRIPDVDLLVEELILSIQGVSKVGDGRYKRKRYSERNLRFFFVFIRKK